MHQHCKRFAATALLGAFGIAHAATANLNSTGFLENFDAMGTSGTTPPSGWAMYKGDAGGNNTWQTSIPGNGGLSVASMIPTTSALTVKTAPTSTNINGYNAAVSAATVADRSLATSPTSVTGAAVQLALVNDTGAAFSSLMVSYDTVRFTSVAANKVEELPGYWLFYSLDGSTWSNVSALNPTQTTVPNISTGISSFSTTFALSAPVAIGSTLRLRWIDDNGVPTSPDQIIGLDNVSIAAVPEPASCALLLSGFGLVGALARRRQRNS
jgi:hypothetical protein